MAGSRAEGVPKCTTETCDRTAVWNVWLERMYPAHVQLCSKHLSIVLLDDENPIREIAKIMVRV